jgi:predicted nucleic acid-binding protein
MTAAVFVDTGVFVYARDASEPEKQPAAAAWIERLWIEQRGRTGVQVLNDYYLTVTGNLDPGLAPEQAWQDVQALFTWDPQPVDQELLALARELERRFDLSWRDSMIVAAAQLQDCDLLLTEELEDGWHCDGLVVCNPFRTKVQDESGRYSARPVPASRHRPRGRPRRQ